MSPEYSLVLLIGSNPSSPASIATLSILLGSAAANASIAQLATKVLTTKAAIWQTVLKLNEDLWGHLKPHDVPVVGLYVTGLSIKSIESLRAWHSLYSNR